MFEVAESNAFYRLSLIRTFDLKLWVCYAGQARQKVKEVVIMLDKEFMGDIGKKQCTKHQKELLQALRQLANALGKDKAYCNSGEFFQDFLNGFWEPFDEISDTGNRKQDKLNEEIRAYRDLIKTKIGPEENALLERYVDLLGSRNGEALNYAFLVGYQCAFRFIMLGLSEPVTVLPDGVS